MPAPRRRPARAHPSLACLLALALLAPALAGASPARAATCVVTSPGDGGPGTLRAALANTDGYADCATITFRPGLGTITATTALEIVRAVTIQGPGAAALAVQHSGPAAIDGMVFSITSGPATLGGLTIRGGRTESVWGGGLKIVGAADAVTVALDGVVVTGNSANNAGGGGIYASNAALTLANSIVSGNTASGRTPRAAWGGGGLLIDDFHGSASATVTNSVVSDNQATNNAGGGIKVSRQIVGRSAALRLGGSSITGNEAAAGGGLANEGGVLIMTDSTVSGNAAGSGGGIENDSGALTVTNSTVSGNTADLYGGGLRNDRGAATLTAVTLVANRAEYGGGLFAGGGAESPSATYIGRSIIAGNLVDGPPQDCATLSPADAPLISEGDNLVGDRAGCPAGGTNDLASAAPLDTILNPTLAENGGPTRTHALAPGSPALDRIPLARCGSAPADQRGVARPRGPRCDVGAVEAVYALRPRSDQGAETFLVGGVGDGRSTLLAR